MTIDSQTVTYRKGWQINERINARTLMTFTLTDIGLLTELNVGDPVSFTDGSVTIFAGLIKEIEEFEPFSGTVWYNVIASDNSALADKRIVADVVENQTPGYIVTNVLLPILAEEGVTAGDIEAGAELKKVVFDYIKVSTALDLLKDISGLNWNIDEDKKLNFFRQDQYLSAIEITDDGYGKDIKSFKRKKTMNQYRNKQYVRAGKGQTALQTAEKPTPEPDGVSRNFVLRFPIAEKPLIYINSVQVSPTDIGINGLDENKKFYFSFNSNVISQDEAETVLVSTDVVEVTYKGLYPILAVVDKPEQIDDRKDKETGTSGIYEELIQETSINTSDQAVEYASGLISKYGQIPTVITYTLENVKVKAGTQQRIQRLLYNIDDYYLIESVSISERENQVMYMVKALDGSALGGWEEFFKDLLKGSRQSITTENEVLIILNQQTETNKITGNIHIDSSPALYPSNTLYPSDTLYPNITSTSEVVVND
jgi:hypothetical protein